MKLRKNTRLLGNGRLSSVFTDGKALFVYIADKSGIVKKKFDTEKETLGNEGRVSFAEDYYDLGFARAERRLFIKSVS